MIERINKILRSITLLAGIGIFTFKILDKLQSKNTETNDGYSQKEYDDIW